MHIGKGLKKFYYQCFFIVLLTYFCSQLEIYPHLA
jgi:hypothetical protein